MRSIKKSKQKGFGTLEVIIGAFIISLTALGAVSVAHLSIKLNEENSNNVKAAFLMEEGVEAMKVMRDAYWRNISNLNTAQDYFLNFNGTTWATTTTNTFIDGTFERKINIANVNRDASTKDIVTSGGVVDNNTKKITVSVSWKIGSATTTKNISTYVTNMF